MLLKSIFEGMIAKLFRYIRCTIPTPVINTPASPGLSTAGEYLAECHDDCIGETLGDDRRRCYLRIINSAVPFSYSQNSYAILFGGSPKSLRKVLNMDNYNQTGTCEKVQSILDRVKSNIVAANGSCGSQRMRYQPPVVDSSGG